MRIDHFLPALAASSAFLVSAVRAKSADVEIRWRAQYSLTSNLLGAHDGRHVLLVLCLLRAGHGVLALLAGRGFLSLFSGLFIQLVILPDPDVKCCGHCLSGYREPWLEAE